MFSLKKSQKREDKNKIIKKMVRKIEINIEQVLLHSKLTVKSGEDAGKQVLARNLDCMKEWTWTDSLLRDPSPWVLPRYRYSMPCVFITHVFIFSYIFIRNILTGGYIFSILVFTLSRDFLD